MKNKTYRILLFLSALISLFIIITGCSYITGGTHTTGETPRWVWSKNDNGNAIVIDRQTNLPIKDVTPREAFDIITASQSPGVPVILDVRTPQEYTSGHLRDAINIDFNSKVFKDEINQLDKDITYIVYCRTGLRSAAAQIAMEEAGFKNAINMTGGISNWEKDGLPVSE
jgi:rhodanese-related sulfurtransferase